MTNISGILQKDLEFNQALVTKLKPYVDRNVSELPDEIKKSLQQIKTGPKITSSGLESVKTILSDFYITNAFLKQAIQNPNEFMKTYSEEKQPITSNKQPKTEDRKQKTENRRQTETIKPEPQTPDNRRQTSDIRPQTSEPSPPPASKIEL